MKLINVYGSLRQWRYPREFRIRAPIWAQAARLDFALLVNRLATPTATPSSEGVGSPRLIAEVATSLWLLRRKMVQPGTDQPREEVRSAYRYFESAWNTLIEAGVEILGHDGQPFDAGLSLNVLAFQPTPGLTRQIVTETQKPSVYYQGHLLQMGEVFVGTPEKIEQPEQPAEDLAAATASPEASEIPSKVILAQHSSQTTEGGIVDEQSDH